MQLVFVSNYFNHHQQPVSDKLYELCKAAGGSYTFVQTEPMEEERIRMGWGEILQGTPYIQNYWEAPQVCERLIAEAEVVIFGGTDEERYIQERLKSGKLILRYSERLYKTGRYKFVSPRGLLKKWKDHTRYAFGKVYLLCSGAYVAGDFRLVLAYPFKKFKYGYFPVCKSYDIDALMAEKNAAVAGTVEMLWAARMIDWKHPEVPLRLASALKKAGYPFHLTMAGGGALLPSVQELAGQLDVKDRVTFLGDQNPERIRALMEKADIYLTTSDYQEGWGAVINEAMNSGCAVVVNQAMGAAPYLITQGQNGFLYHNKKEKELYDCVSRLMEEPALRERMGRNAYETIAKEWNGNVAAERVYHMAADLLAGRKPAVYQSGPLSRV